MPEHMGRDFGQRDHMGIIVLFPDPGHHMLDVQRHLGIAILIQQDTPRNRSLQLGKA